MKTMAEQGLIKKTKIGDCAALSNTLLAWYDRHARVLPWRVPWPRKPDPYCVWLSEIMLQQTTVATVKDYFLKFVQLWPDVESLAATPRDDVLKAWAGLGYYARAHNLHACAKVVVEKHGGQFPPDYASLLGLPGIGPYTAGAIAAIAFDLPFAAVDGNVERVLSRLYAIETPLPASKPEIKQRAQALVPQQRAGDFAQAIMDLGATICTPKNPACALCPWQQNCRGLAEGKATTLPRKAPKAGIPTRLGHAFVVVRDGKELLLRRRPETGLLGGMMEVPGSAWQEQALRQPLGDAPLQLPWRKRPGVVEHTFTHFHLRVTVWTADLAESSTAPLDPSYYWVDLADVDGEALPTVMRKIIAHGLSR
jgi:A/G-specific adenine glycosylase